MPIAVYSVGVFMGTEKYAFSYATNMVLVAIGVAIASYGENLVSLPSGRYTLAT